VNRGVQPFACQVPTELARDKCLGPYGWDLNRMLLWSWRIDLNLLNGFSIVNGGKLDLLRFAETLDGPVQLCRWGSELPQLRNRFISVSRYHQF
jgi:hypothetical protein